MSKEGETTDPERRRLRQTAAILLGCHLLELVLTVWLTADLWSQQRRPLCLALLALLVTANILVAAASLVWVHRQLRFGDRCAGRLVCYLLHAVGGALLWRALKLGLVFDARDVREFATLRHLLVHVQTLPVCLVQMYASYQTGSIGVFPAAPVVALLAGAVTTVVLASSVFSRASGGGGGELGRSGGGGSALSLPTLPEPADSPLAVPRGAAADWTGADDAWSRLLVAVQALCLLWARLTALATFASLWLGWAVGVVALHWTLAAVWLAAQQYLTSEQRSPASKAVRVAFLAYLLIFDWQVNRDSGSALTVCARPRAAAVYYLAVGLQNAVLLGLWVAFSAHIPHTKLATVTGAAATFSVGAVILVMLYCYSAETALGAQPEHVLTAHVGEKPSSVSETYVDYKLEEESAAERRRRVGNLYTAFPVLSRSDRSTDNHSANSRNTNTLCELEVGRGEPLTLAPRRLRHGSPGSDTASSASRAAAVAAVVGHCVTSTPKRAPWEKTPSRPTRPSRQTRHVCAPGAACHCRLFDAHTGLHVLEPRHPAGSHTDGRPFRVLCAGCLRAHDPLLTPCAPLPAGTAHIHGAPTSVSTTDYPSVSEASERASVSSSDGSALSCSTYTTWPPRSVGGEPLSWLLPPDLTGREYVQAWLELCGQRPPPEGRPKKKLCRRQHAGCPQVGCGGVGQPVSPATRPRKLSKKQRLKGVLLKNKLCRRAGRLRARSVSPRPSEVRNNTPPAPLVAERRTPPAPPVEQAANLAPLAAERRTPPAPPVDQAATLAPLDNAPAPAPLPAMNNVPNFVQNVEAYV
ncbi:hypothetical protein FJT64_018806 [Amphibalanus amphitrite]|uniref:XK-related protein n=1 Tax=Amphibalanus amphitrite TaxID=1232801 RepID=A0A6A4WVS7_AMPAM|nr:uncharacterized protein LOC122369800 [Amphibalanus amphitrite]KAF0310113.1 hypothetical protein FJT64_018806 [Amphibalanus amphitrite]